MQTHAYREKPHPNDVYTVMDISYYHSGKTPCNHCG